MDVYQSTDAGSSFVDVLNKDTSTAGRLNKVLLGNAYFGYDSGSGYKIRVLVLISVRN
jgi:hypothetical protein